MPAGSSSTGAHGTAGAYLLCSTPRTGSTLLCGLLESTGVAGHPASYFRRPDEDAFAAQWVIPSPSDGASSYAAFLKAALAAGTTDNGVFAARIMWGTLHELVGRLRTMFPDPAADDLDLLNRAFARPRFVYLRRHDVLGQAVSLLRAEQTDVWHKADGSEPQQLKQDPLYDFDRIRKMIRTIEDDNAAWRQWFASVGVRPYSVAYEDLEADQEEATRGILEFLELELPPSRTILGRHNLLRDQLSAEWVERYRAESGSVGERVTTSQAKGTRADPLPARMTED
jgi:trehalose 2-sulfotransferase